MWPDLVSNQGLLAHESDALPTALRGRCVYDLQQYFNLKNSCPLCFLVSSALKSKLENK